MTFSAPNLALLLFLVSLAGALLPLYRKWSDRSLHVLVALAAGIFLGTIFLDLLPHLAGVGGADAHGAHGAHAGHGHAHEEGVGLLPWVAALTGLLVLFAIERVWLPTWMRDTGADPHTALWGATLLGLSLHAATTGVALTAVLQAPETRTQFLVSMLVHKATETYALATVMRLANLGRMRMLVLLLVFAAIEPAGLLLGTSLVAPSAGVQDLFTGFAIGTFLYVALCDLLPEVFHGVEKPLVKLVAVVAGVGVTAISLPRLAWLADFGERVVRESIVVFVDFAPFLLLGFLVGGVLSQVLRTEKLTRHVRGEDLKSVTVAALVGAPIPLCSCSVVPVAAALRRGGASKGATSSFLIATPETGVDSVTVTWALLDPIMTIARPVGAFLSAVFTGGSVAWFVRRGLDREAPPAPAAKPAEHAHDCCHAAPAAEAPPAPLPEPACHDHGATERVHAPRAPAPGSWIARVLRYAYVEMLDDLAVSLLVGTLLSGLIVVLVPPELFASPALHGFGGMLLMLAIGIPTYVCAAASTPIAATLMAKGLSPGAAFVFLLASPATNVGSLFVLRKVLGTKVILVHVVALSVVTLLLGFAIDAIYSGFGIAPHAQAASGHEHGSWLEPAAAVVLASLIAAALVRVHGPRELFARLRARPRTAA